MQLNNSVQFNNNNDNKLDNNYILNLAAISAQRNAAKKNNINVLQNEDCINGNESQNQCSSLDYLYQAISLIETKNQGQNGVAKSTPSLTLSANNDTKNPINQLSSFYYQPNYSGNIQHFNNQAFGSIHSLPPYQPNNNSFLANNENKPSQNFGSPKNPSSRLEKAKLLARQTSLTPSTSSSPMSSSSPVYLPSPTYSTNSSIVGSDIFNFNIQQHSHSQSQQNMDILPNILPFSLSPQTSNLPFLNNNNSNLNFQNQQQQSPTFHGHQGLNYINTPFLNQQTNDQLFLQNLLSALYALTNSQQKLQNQHQQNQFNPMLQQFQTTNRFSNNHPISLNQIPNNFQMMSAQPTTAATNYSYKKNFTPNESLTNKSCIIMGKSLSSEDISQKVDEHFKKSLGKKYCKIFNQTDSKKDKTNKTTKNKATKVTKGSSTIKKISKLENLINKNQNLIMNNEIFSKICSYKANNNEIDVNADMNNNDVNTRSEYSNDNVYNNNNSRNQICNSNDECNCLNCCNSSNENDCQNDNDNLNNKNNFHDGESCHINQNECLVDADETQSLILSTTSSVSSERLSINTDVYYDEDEDEFIDNDADSEASNNLIMNNSIDYDNDDNLDEELNEPNIKINETTVI